MWISTGRANENNRQVIFVKKKKVSHSNFKLIDHFPPPKSEVQVHCCFLHYFNRLGQLLNGYTAHMKPLSERKKRVLCGQLLLVKLVASQPLQPRAYIFFFNFCSPSTSIQQPFRSAESETENRVEEKVLCFCAAHSYESSFLSCQMHCTKFYAVCCLAWRTCESLSWGHLSTASERKKINLIFFHAQHSFFIHFFDEWQIKIFHFANIAFCYPRRLPKTFDIFFLSRLLSQSDSKIKLKTNCAHIKMAEFSHAWTQRARSCLLLNSREEKKKSQIDFPFPPVAADGTRARCLCKLLWLQRARNEKKNKNFNSISQNGRAQRLEFLLGNIILFETRKNSWKSIFLFCLFMLAHALSLFTIRIVESLKNSQCIWFIVLCSLDGLMLMEKYENRKSVSQPFFSFFNPLLKHSLSPLLRCCCIRSLDSVAELLATSTEGRQSFSFPLSYRIERVSYLFIVIWGWWQISSDRWIRFIFFFVDGSTHIDHFTWPSWSTAHWNLHWYSSFALCETTDCGCVMTPNRKQNIISTKNWFNVNISISKNATNDTVFHFFYEMPVCELAQQRNKMYRR